MPCPKVLSLVQKAHSLQYPVQTGLLLGFQERVIGSREGNIATKIDRYRQIERQIEIDRYNIDRQISVCPVHTGLLLGYQEKVIGSREGNIVT